MDNDWYDMAKRMTKLTEEVSNVRQELVTQSEENEKSTKRSNIISIIAMVAAIIGALPVIGKIVHYFIELIKKIS